MRALILSLLLAAPAAAHDYGCRSYGGHGYGHRTYRSHSGLRWHNYHNRIQRFRHNPWRVQGHSYYRDCGYHRHYRYGYHTYHRHHRRVISFAPFYTRYTTAFTLSDGVFDRKPDAPSYDGLPTSRVRPVGGRFLVDAR